jgi:hypothetical protein
VKALVAVMFVLLSLLAISCSDGTGASTVARDESDGFPEGTLAAPSRGQETAEESPPEATLGPEPADTPAVLLRLEGDPGTTFSGICAVGGEESVLSGRIPKRYAFDPRGQRLSCRIEKQDRRGGALKVILTAGDTTRSVQQTNKSGGVINISYGGG